ncbi:MAG TPA: hypothetical protein VJ728_13785 [Candidatus Binataceae bacterium]|nr:hypothetical protein [Candidatus Binataceae bacterium]
MAQRGQVAPEPPAEDPPDEEPPLDDPPSKEPPIDEPDKPPPAKSVKTTIVSVTCLMIHKMPLWANQRPELLQGADSLDGLNED